MIKKGDILYCHTAVTMLSSKDKRTTVGKRYVVRNTAWGNTAFLIHNDGDGEHIFMCEGHEKWFTLIPKEILEFDAFETLY